MRADLLRHLEMTFGSKSDAFAALDEDLRVKAWSEAMEQLSGLPLRVVLGVTLHDLFPGLRGTDADRALFASLRGEYRTLPAPFFAAATPAQARDTEAFASPLPGAGRVDGCLLLARSASKVRDRERAIAEVEQRFRAMADSSPVLLWMSGPDSLCTFFNQTWLDFSGRTLKEELGVGWAEGVHPEDFQVCMNTYMRAFSARRPFEMEYRLRRHDGQFRWLLDRGVPRFGPDGSLLGFIGSCVDIDDRRVAEQATLALARDLERANLEMEQLLYAASHDLQEPIRMVTNFLELLERHAGPALDDKAVEYLSFAREGGVRMGGLVAGLLAIARTRSGTPRMEAVDMRHVVDLVMGDLGAATFETGAVVDVGELPVVRADAALVRSLVQNLVSNAIKFRGEAPLMLRVGAERRANEWVFSFEDNGIGFAPEDAGRVFELFRRLHPRAERPGNGIGLALAREIVHRHGGQIWAVSEVGRGAAFSFTLPADVRQEEAS